MSNQGLLEAFNNCLDRINAGQSISDCLRLYPQYAASLRPMLEVGSLVERAQVSSFEVQTAQARVRARMTERLQAATKSRPSYTRFALLAASLLVTLVAVIGMAESSLPGDALYGLKRLTEGARTLVTGDQFAARRLEEIRVLLALRRSAQVTFTGEIERIDGEQWRVAGQPVRVPAGTPGVDGLVPGDRVSVEGETNEQGELVARAFTLLEKGDAPPTATPTLTFTPVSTATPSPTFTATAAPTETPTLPLPSATIVLTSTPSVCVPVQPAGWVLYRVQPNDTVAGLASITGASVEQLLAINCLPSNLMIIIGQSLFLPSLPPASSPPVQQQQPGGNSAAPPAAGDDDDDDDDNGGDDDDDD